MKITYDNNIIEKPLHSFCKERICELPKSLGGGIYSLLFDLLKKWYLENTFAINSYKLTSDYIHLLEEE